MYGVAKAETFVQAMYKAGKNPTRASLMNALLSMNEPNKFLLPGIVQKDVEDEPFHHQPDATAAVQREHEGLGACRSARGRPSRATISPARLS